MRPRIVVNTLAVCLLAQASAQSTPVEPPPAFAIAASYTYNNVLIYNGPFFNQSGASIRGEYFFRKTVPNQAPFFFRGGQSEWSMGAEFSGSGSGSGRIYTYLIGPRWEVEWKHVMAFGGLLIGGSDAHVNGVVEAASLPSLTRNAFAYDSQLGADFPLSKHFALELRADVLFLRVPDPSTGKAPYSDGLRFSAGIMYRFGERKP